MLWQQCCFDWFSYCTYRITIWLHCIINIIKLINQIILSATDFFNLFTILTYSGWLHEEYMRCPVCVFSFSIPLLVIYYRGLFVLNSSKIVKSCVLHFHKSEVNFCFIKLSYYKSSTFLTHRRGAYQWTTCLFGHNVEMFTEINACLFIDSLKLSSLIPLITSVITSSLGNDIYMSDISTTDYGFFLCWFHVFDFLNKLLCIFNITFITSYQRT